MMRDGWLADSYSEWLQLLRYRRDLVDGAPKRALVVGQLQRCDERAVIDLALRGFEAAKCGATDNTP